MMLKRSLMVFLATTFFAVSLAPVVAQDEKKKDKETISGTWVWMHKAKSKKVDCELNLKEEDGKVIGKLRAGKKMYKFSDGRFKNGKLKIEIPTGKSDKQYTFSANLEEGKLKGQYTVPSTGDDKKIEMLAKRSVGLSDVVGKWSLYFETPDGDEITPEFTLKEEGGKPVVEFSEQNDRPAMDATKVTFARGVLNIICDVEFQGAELEVEFDLKLKNKTAAGSLYFEFKDGSNSGELDVEGELIK